MQVSSSETQFTREQRQKRSNPSRNMINRKAMGRIQRFKNWQAVKQAQNPVKLQGKAKT